MTAQDHLSQAVYTRLEQLRARVEATVPSLLCDIGSLDIDSSFEIYASFLKSPSAETIDLVVLFGTDGEREHVAADMVQGGRGSVLSEMQFKLTPETSLDVKRQLLEYIDKQERTIVGALQATEA